MEKTHSPVSEQSRKGGSNSLGQSASTAMMSSEEDLDLSLREEDGKGKSSAAKTKRVRQRVDAGEPRNSYASIPNFSSRPTGFGNNGFASKMLCDLIGSGLRPKEDILLDSADRAAVNGSRMFMNGGDLMFGRGLDSPERCSSAESSSSHLLRDILQQGRGGGGSSAGHAPKSPVRHDEDSNESKESCRMSAAVGAVTAASVDRSPGSSRESNSPPLEALWQPEVQASSVASSSTADVKRARVETIVNNMLQGPRNNNASSGLNDSQPPVNGCKKRKLYQPQQHETSSKHPMNGDSELYEEDEEFSDNGISVAKRRNTGNIPSNNNPELFSFKQQIRQVQQQLVALQQQYMEMVVGDSSDDVISRMNPTTNTTNSNANNNNNNNNNNTNNSDVMNERPNSADLSDCEDMKPRIDQNKDIMRTHKPNSFVDYDNTSLYDEQRRLVIDDSKDATSAQKSDLQELRQSCIVQPSPCPNLDYEWLAESLKAELSTSLSQVVDEVLSRCVQRKAAMAKVSSPPESEPPKDPTLLSQMLDRKSPRTGKVIDRGTRVNGHGLCGLRTSPYPPDIGTAPKPSFFFPLKPPTSVSAATAAFLYGSPPQMPQSYSSPAHSTPTPQDAPEQTEAMSLVVTPKKKRHKVTDTRLHQRPGGPLCGLRDDVSPKYTSMLDPLPPVYHHPPPPLVPVSLPTTVAIPNPSLNQSELFHSFPYDRLSHHFGAPPMEPPSQDDDGPPMQLGSLNPMLPFHGHHQRGSPDSLHLSHLKQQSNENGDISDAGDSPAGYDSGMTLISFPRKINYSQL